RRPSAPPPSPGGGGTRREPRDPWRCRPCRFSLAAPPRWGPWPSLLTARPQPPQPLRKPAPRAACADRVASSRLLEGPCPLLEVQDGPHADRVLVLAIAELGPLREEIRVGDIVAVLGPYQDVRLRGEVDAVVQGESHLAHRLRNSRGEAVRVIIDLGAQRGLQLVHDLVA